MENKIMMPASYNVLSCEEMTYTEGGATVGQAVAAWLWPGYATVIGINTCREARKKDHDNWASNVWSDIKADCKGNVTNTFYHAGMIFWNAASTISSFGLSADSPLHAPSSGHANETNKSRHPIFHSDNASPPPPDDGHPASFPSYT